MRLLIGGSNSFFFHLKEFSDTLNKLGVESKLVFDADYSDGFPSRKIRNWFQTSKKFTKLIDDFVERLMEEQTDPYVAEKE